jgi:hypothetical protein
MATFSKFALSLVLVSVAGCTQVDHGFGEALKYDMTMQTIDPDPIYPPGGAQPGDSGERGANAVQRYLQGSVTDVASESTTTGVSGSSSGPK